MVTDQSMRELTAGMDSAELYAAQDIYRATKCGSAC
jgi:hypothetical protein